MVLAEAKKELEENGSGDSASLEVLKHYLTYFARFLADQACIFMPFGGIYLTSSVSQACSFLLMD
jgi:glucokinase